AWNSPVLSENDWSYQSARDLMALFPDAEGEGRLHYAASFGQSIFTPEDLTLRIPDPRDRPYAGWLYLGSTLTRETGTTLDRFDAQLGVVGPAAGGETAQNTVHDLIKNLFPAGQARGWSFQIKNEPGLVLAGEREWRATLSDGPLEADL